MALILGAGLLAGGVMLFLLLPILRGDWATFHRSDDEPTEAEARKGVALKGLRDAEYDYATGKLDDDDYLALKGELSRQALTAMEEASRPGEASPGGAADDLDDLEAEIARARHGLAEGHTCHSCGHVSAPGSKFCSSCGGRLATTTTAEAPSVTP